MMIPTRRSACLEEHIEELAAKIESCRKFILASRIAVAAGSFVRRTLVGAIGLSSGSWQWRSRYCSAALLYGFEQEHRKRGDEGDGRSRVGARAPRSKTSIRVSFHSEEAHRCSGGIAKTLPTSRERAQIPR